MESDRDLMSYGYIRMAPENVQPEAAETIAVVDHAMVSSTMNHTYLHPVTLSKSFTGLFLWQGLRKPGSVHDNDSHGYQYDSRNP